MKKIGLLILALSCLSFFGCNIVNDDDSIAGNGENDFYDPSYYQPDDIVINGRTFAKTGFVTVIESGSSVRIPSGYCSNGKDADGKDISDVFHEQRTVKLSGFTIGKYEVTQELYEYVMHHDVPFADRENCYGNEKQPLRPAAGMNWYEACLFCNKLSELLGYDEVYTITNISYVNRNRQNQYINSANITRDLSKNGFRLPTEAEWEYAARGAGKSAEDWTFKYSGSNISKQVAWTSMNSSGYSDDDETLRTHQVGLKRPNALGIYDMSGNVSEWCMDWFRTVTENEDYTHGNRVNQTGESENPILAKGQYNNHVIRGGNYKEGIGYSSNWQRLGIPSNAGYFYINSNSYLGIRLVRRP